ncbi:MAG: hypothetical protein RLY67_296, partial [Pseudomonadota bacterium]
MRFERTGIDSAPIIGIPNTGALMTNRRLFLVSASSLAAANL